MYSHIGVDNLINSDLKSECKENEMVNDTSSIITVNEQPKNKP